MAKRPKIVSEGVLYRNPTPGYKAECAYVPNAVALPGDELLCVYRLGSAFYSPDGSLAKLRSTDGGQTWVQEGLVWGPAKEEVPHSYTAPHTTRLRDGTLLLVAQRKGAEADHLGFNPDTGGMQSREAVLLRSADNGHTWTAPEALDLPGRGVADTPSQIIELENGRWFLACELWKEWDDASPLHIKGFALFSDDQGKTWAERVDFPSASDPDKMYSHSRYTQMLDGRIAALQWTQKVGTGENYELHFVLSDLTGREWAAPCPTGLMGQTSWLADLGDGLLAATYSSREGMRPGVNVVLSKDGGRTWDVENQVMVWDAVGQEYLGVVHKPSYPTSHDNIAFGKPNTLRLPNGEILSCWWCTQACVTHCRFARLVVE